MAPLTPKFFQAAIDFRDFQPPAVLTPHAGISISTVRLNHPNGAVGYRVDYNGRSLCYVTDTEHRPGRLDESIVAAIGNADVLIYDVLAPMKKEDATAYRARWSE